MAGTTELEMQHDQDRQTVPSPQKFCMSIHQVLYIGLMTQIFSFRVQLPWIHFWVLRRTQKSCFLKPFKTVGHQYFSTLLLLKTKTQKAEHTFTHFSCWRLNSFATPRVPTSVDTTVTCQVLYPQLDPTDWLPRLEKYAGDRFACEHAWDSHEKPTEVLLGLAMKQRPTKHHLHHWTEKSNIVKNERTMCKQDEKVNKMWNKDPILLWYRNVHRMVSKIF